MRGFLRSSDTLLSLAPKITTVGRENCDITIQSPSVDLQHALVEFCEEEHCFVLQDLNSSQGTYINDTRIQNAAVRLAPFDQIRFGFGSAVYQFELDDPSIQQRGWQANSSITRNPYQTAPQEQGLPQLPPTTQPANSPVWVSSATNSLPQPPAAAGLRSRPLSAGVRRTQTEVPPAIRGSWVTPAGDRSTDSPTADLASLQLEKDQKIQRLTDELNRLQAIQKDNERKKLKIEQLTTELAELKEQNSAQQQINDTNKQIDKLEKELQSKKVEIVTLKDKVGKLEKARKNLISEDTVPLQEFNDKLQELHSVRAELERVRKDKNIISGLVNQTQRDMSCKDTSISRLTREIEQLKKDVRNRDVQIATLTSKMARVKQSAQDSSEETARDKELVGLRLQFKNAEGKIQEMTDSLKTMKGEIDRKTTQLADANADQMRLQSEAQHCKAEFLDAQRAERAARVDLEQATKKGERFRNRVIQVAFSTPGVKYPDDGVPDDQVMDSLKKIIDERTNNQKQITELKDQVRQLTGQERKGDRALKALKQHLTESLTRLKENGLLTTPLRQELSLLQAISLSGAPEVLQTIKQTLVDLSQMQLTWQQDIEDALQRCGINVTVSTDSPAKHINGLYAKWEAAIKEKDGAESAMKMIEASHKAELATQAAHFKEEMTDKVAEAKEKARLEAEQRMNQTIEDLRSVEAERRENAVEAERRKCEELEANMAALKNSFVEQRDAEKEKVEAANEALRRMEEGEKYQESLKKEIEAVELARAEELSALSADYEAKLLAEQENLQSYKEQIKQHSVTICSMEERLNKAQKKSKTLTQENSSLKQKVQELSSRPQPKKQTVAEPPKPKVIIEQVPTADVVGLQQTIATVRQECLDLKKINQEQQNVILALKKDLAGAQARLSDMTGEIPDSHKQELEMNRDLVRQKSQEVVELQQQLAKLSTIVDKKTAAMSSSSTEISALKTKLERMDKELAGKEEQLRSMEMKIISATESHNEQSKALEEDNQIKQELSSLGLACRGERHQLVIERQREALSELRRRIKDLEVMKTGFSAKAGGAADAALKQVDLLKRELAEMRSGNLADEHAMHDLQQMAAVERAVNKARGITSAADTENEHEKSAHRETQDALEESERTYLGLLRGIASCLDLEEVGGLQSMAHLPADERIRLQEEREAAAEALTFKIKALKERLTRKDELLRNYERDLAKLRQAELLVAKKSEQVEQLVNDVQARLDETMYLRASLDKTKDTLHQERRLNDSIKKKKTFHLENEKGPFVTNRRHVCPPDDLLAKEAAKKKKQIERIRRKNYEIKTLKEELQSKHSELCHTTTRLANLENDFNDEARFRSPRKTEEVLS